MTSYGSIISHCHLFGGRKQSCRCNRLKCNLCQNYDAPAMHTCSAGDNGCTANIVANPNSICIVEMHISVHSTKLKLCISLWWNMVRLTNVNTTNLLYSFYYLGYKADPIVMTFPSYILPCYCCRHKRQAPFMIFPEILVIVDYDGYR